MPPDIETFETFETLLLTLLALISFASNSILTRLALSGHVVDPFSFTAVRLAAGAVVLDPRSETTHWTPRATPTTATTSTARRASRRAVSDTPGEGGRRQRRPRPAPRRRRRASS